MVTAPSRLSVALDKIGEVFALLTLTTVGVIGYVLLNPLPEKPRTSLPLHPAKIALRAGAVYGPVDLAQRDR